MDNNRYTQIDDYLDGALNTGERQAFEALLQTDPALAQALATVREARERLRKHWADETADAPLRQTLQSLERDFFKSRGQARTFQLPRIAWAAAAALACLAVAWFFLRPPADERLYARYRAFPEADFTTKSADVSSLQPAATAFNATNYAGALEHLQNYLAAHPDDLEARLFAGLCYLELGRYQEADAIFQTIYGEANAWADEARWYLALSYLRQGKHRESAGLLQQIPAGSAHYQEAQKLLGEL